MTRAAAAVAPAAPAARIRPRCSGGPVGRALLLALLLALGPPAAAGPRDPPCPAYCVCNVTIEVFYEVACSRSSLEDVPPHLPSKPYTTKLNMSHNHLSKLRQNALDGFSQLYLLDLNDNRIKDIDRYAFTKCTKLRTVYLSRNRLSALPPSLFENNKYLEFLDLSHNALAVPNAPFLRCPSLLILNLTHTELNQMPRAALVEMRQLKRLDLSYNYLRHVETAAISFLTNISVTLRGNPLRCDCSLHAMWRWHQDQSPRPTQRPAMALEDDAKCNEPGDMKGLPLDAILGMLDCGEGRSATAAGFAGAGAYAVYGALAFLAAGAVALVAAVVVVRRRRGRRGSAESATTLAGAWRRPKRMAPPVGEYIEVLPDAERANKAKPANDSEAVYEVVPEKKASTEGSKSEAKWDASLRMQCDDSQRYVTDLSRCTYMAPSVPPRSTPEEPVYVNMTGPPLPQRTCSDAPALQPSPSCSELSPSPSPSQSPQPPTHQPPKRPCSVPLLEGCDFYEVVD